MRRIYFDKTKDIENAQLCVKEMFKDQVYVSEWNKEFRSDIECIQKQSYYQYNAVNIGYKGIDEVESKSKSYVLGKLEAEWPKVFGKINDVFDCRGNDKFDEFVEKYTNEYKKFLGRWAVLMYGRGNTDYLYNKPSDIPMDYVSDIRGLLGNLLQEYVLKFSLDDVDEDDDYVWMNFSISGGGFFKSVDYRARIKTNRYFDMLNKRLSEYAAKAHIVMREYFLNTLL